MFNGVEMFASFNDFVVTRWESYLVVEKDTVVGDVNRQRLQSTEV